MTTPERYLRQNVEVSVYTVTGSMCIVLGKDRDAIRRIKPTVWRYTLQCLPFARLLVHL